MGISKRDSDLPEYTLIEHEEMLMGIGYGDEAINRVQIGVVSSWGEINPAAIYLDRVAQAVKAGVWSGGGTPREFVISSLCTSMVGGDNYHLPHRDLVAGYIEAVAQTNLFDGLVLVPVCDDVVPAHLMAAARVNVPSIVVTGGYMLLNKYKGDFLDPFDVPSKYYEKLHKGNINKDEFIIIKDRACPGGGACPTMATANTMSALAEAVGMTLPGNATLPGVDSRLYRLAFNAGQQIVRLIDKDIKPSDIMTFNAFKNAIRVLMAVGGSTNAVLHLQAIASELDLYIPLETFNEISDETPFICDVAPSGSGQYNLRNLDEAGGIQAVMKELNPLLDVDVLTVTGKSVRENLKRAKIINRKVIYSRSKPLSKDGGLVILKGNLAPRGAVVKKSAVPAKIHQFRGVARVFSNEDQACDALTANEISPGNIVILRYLGPKGDPGMRISCNFLWQLAAKGMEDSIALITDGRLSGSNKGCAVAHVTPEAEEGGPLAIVRDGDIIEINIPRRRLHIEISDDELKGRLKAWKPPSKKLEKGYLAVYRRMAKSADKGAALNYKE